ncbi:MAG TPA: BON domain-containing protein [Isosphaeraceae bacterium]|nr:BON domain-containing protein [Isosphaeraceae bacterium]
MLVGLKRISAALGVLALFATTAQAQTVAMSRNQETANAVAATLRTSEALAPYRIEIETRDGQVVLKGAVATPALHYQAISLAQQVPGVSSVVDRLQVVGDRSVRPAQYQMAAGGGPFRRRASYVSDGSMDGAGTMTQPVGDGGPLPEGPAGIPGATQAAMPGTPNYAWPSYAPHPNFSAVGYPTAYPWQAWPNIGPFYPYPEVPLDWRAVTLRWDDGIWWLDFKNHYTRPFFIPYPFGICGY